MKMVYRGIFIDACCCPQEFTKKNRKNYEHAANRIDENGFGLQKRKKDQQCKEDIFDMQEVR